MFLDVRDPHRYPLQQELEFDIPAYALSCQELKAGLVYKGPQRSVAFYQYYRVSCSAILPAVCLADSLQASGVKDSQLRSQLKQGPGEWAPVSDARIVGPFGQKSQRQPYREGEQNISLCSCEMAYSF